MASSEGLTAVLRGNLRMLSDDAFLRTIFEQPDEDAPRLVYADWLEERGSTARAELIRIQCSQPDAERERELLAAHASEWAGPAFHRIYAFGFRRGFVEEITIQASMFLDFGHELMAQAPLRLIRLIGARGVLTQLVDSPLLSRLRALHLTDCQIGDDGAIALARSPHLSQLQTLRLGHNSIGDRGTEALTASPYLTNLTTLVLHGNLIGDLGAQLLAASDRWPDLLSLDLSDNLIGVAGAEALASSAGYPRLTRLDVSNQFKGWSAGQAQRGRPYPIQPRQQHALISRFGPSTCVF